MNMNSRVNHSLSIKMNKMCIILIFANWLSGNCRADISGERQQTQEWSANLLNVTTHPQNVWASSQDVDLLYSGHIKPTVLIGIMMTDREPLKKMEAYRRSLKNFTENGSPQCNIILFFFFGRAASRPVGVAHGPDIIRGKFPENMNTGKTREWFRWAVTWYEQNRRLENLRSVVIKMDSDTAVKWAGLDSLVPQFTSSAYFGKLQGRGQCRPENGLKCLTGRLPSWKCLCAECRFREGFHGIVGSIWREVFMGYH